jgi:inorganic triphosphatase YgiF
MAHEIELKLDAPAKAAARLPKVPWLQKLISAPVHRGRIASVYFDTRLAKLRAAGISVRVRHIGDKTVQTVKYDPKGACGAFRRQEWEWKIAHDKPDLDLAKDTPLAQFNPKKLRRKLRPVFETDVERTAIPISHHDYDLELAIDRGEVRAGRRSEPISEIEIEVKNGGPVDVVRFARRIAADTAAGYGAKTKAERGYALSAGEQHRPTFADEIILHPTMPAGEAFQAIGFSCLHHFAANQDAVVHGDPEGVHQMRVGLRRFRAGMSFFKELIAHPNTEAIKRELKWLTEQLGPARDLSVLVNDIVKPLEQEEPEAREVAVFENDLENRRRAAFARAKATIEGERYRKLVLECALWLAGGAWFTSADPLIVARRDIPMADFAAGELSRRNAKIIKQSKKLHVLDARRRHKVRIAIKKFRYGCEFLSSLYEDPKPECRRKTLIAALKRLQSALGTLNDIQVHGRLAHSFVHPRPGVAMQTQKAFAIGLLTGRKHNRPEGVQRQAILALKVLPRRLSRARGARLPSV